jgi:hypothetical protein
MQLKKNTSSDFLHLPDYSHVPHHSLYTDTFGLFDDCSFCNWFTGTYLARQVFATRFGCVNRGVPNVPQMLRPAIIFAMGVSIPSSRLII